MTYPAPPPRPYTKGEKATGTAAAIALAIAAAVPMVKDFEGKRNDPYRDIVGIVTVCYGETAGVQKRHYSDAECDALLVKSMTKHAEAIEACIPHDAPTQTRAAYISFAYNVGSTAFCKSSLSRKARAGNLWGSCAELSKWDKARVNGILRPVKGLTTRRAAERALCERGLLR